MTEVDNFKFVQIVDTSKFVNRRVNLIGLAVETSIPKTTKGTDCFCSVRIIDKSQPSGIQLRFFAESMEKLPSIECAGDIVLVSDVVIRRREEDTGEYVYALFQKRFSAFALFQEKGSNIRELVPYQISAKYKPRHQNNTFIMGLRKWSYGDKIQVLRDSLSLKEIKVSQYVNLLCKILHIAQVGELLIIFVWDGTDTPPASIEAKLDDEMENPLPLALEPSLLSRDILCTFPSVGTVLSIIVDQDQEKLGIKFLKVNRWVKFINLWCETHAALWRAVLKPFSKICYLPDDDNTVVNHQRSYSKRFASRFGRMPLTSYPSPSHITVTDHREVPFVTLMDVLTYPEVMYKFKCVVRVVALYPWRPEDFRSPSGIYRIRLTLEDPTARIHAFLY